MMQYFSPEIRILYPIPEYDLLQASLPVDDWVVDDDSLDF